MDVSKRIVVRVSETGRKFLLTIITVGLAGQGRKRDTGAQQAQVEKILRVLLTSASSLVFGLLARVSRFVFFPLIHLYCRLQNTVNQIAS